MIQYSGNDSIGNGWTAYDYPDSLSRNSDGASGNYSQYIEENSSTYSGIWQKLSSLRKYQWYTFKVKIKGIVDSSDVHIAIFEHETGSLSYWRSM